jgi:DNA mismatch endonuclease (patch repair protein)
MTGWVRTKHAQGLSGRRGSDTRVEKMLRRALWRSGLRYRLQPPLGERLKADLLLLPSRVCVFVDGCYWHQCPRHKPAPRTGPNVELWREKFARTRERDLKANALAREIGYTPMRSWECDIVRDVDAVARRLNDVASGARRRRPVPEEQAQCLEPRGTPPRLRRLLRPSRSPVS